MKISILGGGGIRTPMLVSTIIKRKEVLGIDELWLMDIDQKRLDLTGKVIDQIIQKTGTRIPIIRTVDAKATLENADFVITTFRVGGMEHRIIDERVALSFNVIGQETTGPGGFAMAMRTIPVLNAYIEMMKSLCPDAWLLNFANPSGLLTEFILNHSGWKKAVGICDGPSGMLAGAAKYLNLAPDDIYMEYFGLNHLGWIRQLIIKGENILPKALSIYPSIKKELGLPFSNELIQTIGMLPNEYLHYYYSSKDAIEKILLSESTRGEHIHEINEKFFHEVASLNDGKKIEMAYQDYQVERWKSYMAAETGNANHKQEQQYLSEAEGYSGVALNLIQSIQNDEQKLFILNVVNNGSISNFPNDAVVEVPVLIGSGTILPLSIGEIPLECLGLMNQVKAYERLTINAVLNGSYSKALHALTIHPLVMDGELARKLLDCYILEHKGYFPELR